MAWTAAQRAALERAEARLSGREREDDDLTEAQREALRRADERVRQGGGGQTYVDPYGNRYTPQSFQESEEDDKGLVDRVLSLGEAPARMNEFVGSLGRGIIRGAVNLSTLPDVRTAERLPETAEYERDRAERAESGDLPLWERIVTGRFTGREDPEELEETAAEAAQRAAERRAWAAETFPMSERGGQAVRDITGAQSFREGLSAAVSQPLATAQGGLEVLSEQALPMAAGLATRRPQLAVPAMAASDYTQERYGQLVSEAAEAGYDLTDPEQARAAVNDREFMERQAQRGRTRGSVMFVANILSGGLAARAPQSLIGVAGNTGAQMGIGAGSEATAEYLDTGTVQPGEVIMEGLVEGATAPADVAALGREPQQPLSSSTDLSPEDAAQSALDEAALSAQARREAEEAEAQEAAKERARKEARLAARPTFISEQEFLKVRDQQRQEALLDPETEIGQDFREWQMENDIYDATPQIQKEFLQAYVPPDDADIGRAEYVEALDQHAEFKQAEAQRAPETQAEIEETKSRLIAERQAAMESGDAEALRLVEQEAANVLLPGEWRAAKFEADGIITNKTATESTRKAVEETAAKETTGTGEDAAPAQTRAPRQTKKDEMRAYAQDKLGPDWEAENPELSQMISDGRSIYPKRKGATPRFVRMVDRLAGEDAATQAQAAAQDASPQAGQATTAAPTAEPTGPDAEATDADAQTPAETLAQVPPEDRPEARTKMRRDVIAKANELLTESWRSDHPDIVDAIAKNRLQEAEARIDELSARAVDGEVTDPEVEPDTDAQETDAQETDVQETDAPVPLATTAQGGTPAQAVFTPRSKVEENAVAFAEERLGENWQTVYPDLVDTLQDRKYALFQREVEAQAEAQQRDIEETQGTETAARIVATSDQLSTALSGNQKAVFDTLIDALQNNEVDRFLQAGKAVNFKDLAEASGVGSRQAARAAMQQVRPKIAEVLGVTEDKVAEALRSTSRRTTEEATAPDDPVSVVDGSEFTDTESSSRTMGRIDSLGGSQSATAEGLEAADAEFTAARSQETDAVYERRVAEAQQRRERDIDETLRSMPRQLAKDAITFWDNLKSDGAVPISRLSKEDAYEWVMAVQEFLDDRISREALDADQRDIERQYDAEPQEAVTDGQQTTPEADVIEGGYKEGGRDTRQVGAEDGRDARGGGASARAGGEADQTPQERAAVEDAEVSDGTSADIARQISDADPTPRELRNQKSFKEAYAEKDGRNRALWENPALSDVAEYADWLGSLTQEQWDKINPSFTNDLNPFKNAGSIDPEAAKAKLEAALEEPETGGASQGAEGEVSTPDTGVVGTQRTARVETRQRKKLSPEKLKALAAQRKTPKMGTSPFLDPNELLGSDYFDIDADYSVELASRDKMERVFEELTGKRKDPRVHIFDTLDEALDAVEAGDLPPVDTKRIWDKQPFGWVAEDDNGDAHVHMILGNIPAGGERAAFMHEVGGHMGIDEVLNLDERETIAQKIFDWAKLEDGSQEAVIANRAVARADFADSRGGVTEGNFASEVIAYFLEEATNAGIEPTVKNPVGRLLRNLYAAFKKAMRRLRMANVDNLTPQDVVDIAYGAARINLSTRWHGTGADFRKFDLRFMGSGEGNQAFGFGMYLAERFAIGRFYLNAMQKQARKDARKKAGTIKASKFPEFTERLAQGGIRLMDDHGRTRKNNVGSPREAYVTLPELKNATKDTASFDIGPRGPVVIVETRYGTAKHSLSTLVDPAEDKPLFSADELQQLTDAISREIFPEGEPEGVMMSVDTTVDDSEMVNWFDDLRSENGSQMLSLLELLDDADADAVGARLTDFVKAKNRLKPEDVEALSDQEWEDMVLSTRVGELYQVMSREIDTLMPYVSEDAQRRATSYETPFVRGKALVSAFLDENGIKGIIYNDAESRAPDTSRPLYNRVIFDDRNLIVVGRTRGNAARDQRQTVREARFGINRDHAKMVGGDKLAQLWDDSTFIFRNAANSTKFLHQFIREVRDTMPAAKRWYDALLNTEKTRNDIRQSVESIAARARDLAPERLALVNDFIGKSTFYQKWGYDPKWEGRKVKVDPIMSKAFKRLRPEEQQLVKAVFQHGEDMRKSKAQLAKNFGVEGKFFTAESLDGPYAPLKRFGNFAAELKSQELINAEMKLREKENKINRDRVNKLKSDDKHYVISFFDTLGAARQFTEANKQNYAYAEASERAPDLAEDRVSNPEAFQKVLSALKADESSAIDSDAKRAFGDMVKTLYFQSLDERDARQSGAKRLNRAGYDKNMMRSFLSHARAEAALVANLKNGTEVNAALAAAHDEARQDRANLQPIYNMMVRHYRDVLSTKETPIQDRLAAINTTYMLTTSIGYHVTNATQPYISVMRLAGDFNNYTRAWSSLFNGYRVARQVVKSSFFRQAATTVTLGAVDTKNKIELDLNNAPEKYRQILHDLELRQLLDVGLEEDLAGFDRFNTGYAIIDKGSEAFGTVTHRLYQIARYVEAYNRVSAAVAAYDMAGENPDALKAMDMTREEYTTAVLEDTQGNFSRLDSPFLLKFLPKLTGQYRKYQVMMAWVYADAAKKAFTHENPKVRAMGKRTLAYTLIHTGLFAGATGIPLLNFLGSYALAFMNEDEEEPQNLERWIRENVEDETLADVLARGLPASLGFDMSLKLSQGDIFHPLPYADFEVSESGLHSLFFNAALGPFGATATNFVRSASYFSEGDVQRGIEYMVPKGARSMIETHRFATEGYSLRNGDIIVDPTDFDFQDLFLNTLGLPSTEVNKIKWTRGQQYELEQWFSSKSGDIRRQYVEAYEARDSEKMAELRKEFLELQDAKDRVRPFFNDSRNVLRRQLLTDLIRAPMDYRRRERRYREQMGTLD